MQIQLWASVPLRAAILFLASCPLTFPTAPTSAVEKPPSAAIDMLQKGHKGPSDLFHAHVDASGQVAQVVGRFPTRADPDDPASFAAAVFEFLDGHRELFQLGKASLQDRIVITRISTNPKHGHTSVRAFQVRDGTRLRSSEFVVAFDPRGELIGLTGRLFGERKYSENRKLAPESVLALTGKALDLDAGQKYSFAASKGAGGTVAWQATAERAKQCTSSTARLERQLDPDLGVAVWVVSTDAAEALLEEPTATLLRVDSRYDPEMVTAQMRHRSYDFRFDLNRSTGTRDAEVRLDLVGRGMSGTHPYCDTIMAQGTRDGHWFPTLPLRDLQHTTGTTRTLHAFTPECRPHYRASPTSPKFHQFDTFYWISRARELLVQGWFDSPPIHRTRGLRVVLNADNTCPDSSECFGRPGTCQSEPTIFYDRERDRATAPVSFDTALHEYGHYFSWTYGGFASGRTKGVDESDAVNETVSDLIAILVTDREALLAGQRLPYLVPWQRLGAGGSSTDGTRHSFSSPLASYATAQFGAGALAAHDFGAFFEQAIWEILHDVDCSKPGQDCLADVLGSRDLGWAHRTDAQMSIVKALAFAIEFTPPSLTFDYLGTWMVWYWYVIQGRPDLARAAGGIMQHHGMCVMVGC